MKNGFGCPTQGPRFHSNQRYNTNFTNQNQTGHQVPQDRNRVPYKDHQKEDSSVKWLTKIITTNSTSTTITTTTTTSSTTTSKFELAAVVPTRTSQEQLQNNNPNGMQFTQAQNGLY
ncbi:hypothetical protein ACTFIR_003817 [Dictyostelium discoideum]